MSVANIIAACACAAKGASKRITKNQSQQTSHQSSCDSSCNFNPHVKIRKQYYFEPASIFTQVLNDHALLESFPLIWNTIKIPAKKFAITRTFLVTSTNIDKFMQENFEHFCTIIDMQDEQVIDQYFSEVRAEHNLPRDRMWVPKYTTQYFWTVDM